MSETGREKANSARGKKASGLLSRMELERENKQLKQQVEQLNTLHKIGKLITSALELDTVLTHVVEAAVFITRAEEGVLMLLDEQANELYVRAQKGLGERYAQTLRLRVDDSLAGNVLRMGKSMRLSEESKVVTGYMVNAIIYVPLVCGEQILGVLSVDNREAERSFDEGDEHLLLVLADYAAIAIENARLVEDLRERTQVLTSLHRTGRSMLSALALDEVLNQIAKSALEVLEADIVVLYEYDKRKDDVVVPPIIQGAVRKPEVLHDRGSVVPHKQSVVFKMIRRGQSFYAPNAEVDWAETGFISLPEETKGEAFIAREGIVSSAGIPLIAGDETVGIVFVNYRTSQQFAAEARELIEIFANQAAIAIQNARLMQDKERRIEGLAGLLDTSRIMTISPTELKDVLHRIVENARKVVGSDYALVLPYDGRAGRFQDDLIKASGVPRQIALAIQGPRSNGTAAEVMKKGIVVVTNVQDIEKYPFIRRDVQSFVVRARVQSLVGARLQVGQEPVGVLYADFCTPRHFSEDELQALQLFANQAAIAIQNARLFETAQRHVEELSALYDVSLDITRQLEVKPLLQTIVQRAADLLGANGGGLLLRHPKREEIEMVVAYKLPILLGMQFEFGQGLVGRVAHSGKPLTRNDYHAWEDRDRRFDEEGYKHLFKAVVGVPLQQENEVIGVLAVSDTNESRVFEDSDVKLLERFATQAVIAIGNARMVRELRLLEERYHALYEVGKVAVEIPESDMKGICQEIMNVVAEKVFHFKASYLRLVNEDGDLEIMVAGGIAEKYPRPESILRRGEGITSQILDTRESLYVGNVQREKEFKYPKWAKENDVRSYLGVPLIVEGKVVGTITVYTGEEYEFTEAEVRFLERFASLAALVIDKAREVHRTKKIAEALWEVTPDVVGLSGEGVYGDLWIRTNEIISRRMPNTDLCLYVCDDANPHIARLMESSSKVLSSRLKPTWHVGEAPFIPEASADAETYLLLEARSPQGRLEGFLILERFPTRDGVVERFNEIDRLVLTTSVAPAVGNALFQQRRQKYLLG